MAKTITPIKGTDIISKTCDIINDNFTSLDSRLKVRENDENAAGYAVEKIEWDKNNNKFKITLNNGTEIESDKIQAANQNRSGLLSNSEQLIGGDKLFGNNITLSSNDSKLYGSNNKLIVQQDGNNVYIGGKNGIVIKYDDAGNFNRIIANNLSNLSDDDIKIISTYIEKNLSSAVDKLTKQTTDSSVTLWQIDGYNSDSSKEVEYINSLKLRPWKNDGNNDDSAHIDDVLYSKMSKTYYEFTEDYVWIISKDNIFASINEEISGMQSAIEGIKDGERKFILATRTQMYNGANVSKHSKGDIWVVKADEKETVADENPYKKFVIGGFYLCESSSDDEHTGKDSTHSNGNNWTLLTDYNSYLELQMKSGGLLEKTVNNANEASAFIKNATSDGIISVPEKLTLIKEWYEISGQKDITKIDFDNLSDKYNLGSYGDALQTAINAKTYDESLSTDIATLSIEFRNLGTYLKKTIKIGDTPLVHTVLNDVGTDKKTFLGIFNTYYKAEQNIYSKISKKSISDANTALKDAEQAKSDAAKALEAAGSSDSPLLSAFDVQDGVVQYGNTTINGGLLINNMLYVSDPLNNNTTGGLSGLKNDEVGLFLGSTYEAAYGAANWDGLKDDVKQWYKNSYTGEKNAEGKPTDVPVLLTKSGYGSNIGGCYFDENLTMKVPVGNIDGEITCKSLKADNDSTNPNDAEATVTSNAFKIKYGNAYIEISLVNGVPTIIGVDSNGDTSWSFGAGSNDSAMYNLIYNAIYGSVLYETKQVVSTNVYEFDSLKSKVNISLPTFTIVNKYNPALTYSDDVDGTACRIIPLKTRMKYKIGNKVKYFSYDVTQKCPYYAEVIDILCGFSIDIDTDNTSQSLMYYLYKNEIDKLVEYISNKYGITLTKNNLEKDIVGNSDTTNKKYIDKHDMTYSQYYIEYIKFSHLSEYNCAIYKAYYNSAIDGQDATLDDYTYNYVSAGENKIMNFHDDFKNIENEPTKYTYFYNNFTTNSGESTYEVKILNQDGEWRNIIAGNNKDGDLPYESSSDKKPSYVITDTDADWATYKDVYCEKKGISKSDFNYKYLFVFDKQDGLPTPRNLCELAFNTWWYSLNSIVYKANNDDYNEEYDDFYPRIFDVTCEIELFDTGAGGEHTNTMTHIDKVSKYNYERLFNVYKNSTEASEKESKKKYTNLKLVYANYNVTNVLQYNETEAYIEYRLSITESISGDVYTITHTSKDTLYLLNGEKISDLPAELSEFFSNYNMTVTFTLDKTRGNTANVSIFDESSGKITFSGENSSDFKEDVLYIDMKVTPPTKDKLDIDESNGTIDFDTATTSTELPNTISVTRLYEDEAYSSAYQKMIIDPAINTTTSDDTAN
jgi:hypothetical protein